MTSSSFYEENSNLLTPGVFAFVLDNELKRARRSQNYLTLVTLEASRERQGMTVPVDQATVHEVATTICREFRDTDVIGHSEDGMLALALLNADFEHSTKVIDRLVSRIEHHEFTAALRIVVGAACCPTDAADAASLKRRATERPIVIVRWRGTSPDGATPVLNM